MKSHEQIQDSPEAILSREGFAQPAVDPSLAGLETASITGDGASASNQSDENPGSKWEADINQTLELGKQFLGFAIGVLDLARAEAALAVRTAPKLVTLWLLMVPIILLTWCAFSILLTWVVIAASNQIGLGIFTFFMLQVFLLLVCYWLTIRYRARMKFSHTRAQVSDFFRSIQYEVDHRNKTKE